MKKDKIYTVTMTECVYGVVTCHSGTVEELSEVHALLLTHGKRRDNRVRTEPKTGRQLIRSLKRAARAYCFRNSKGKVVSHRFTMHRHS